MKVRKSSVDLTQGSIVPQILKFAFPILCSQIFQHLYNSVDSIVVGQFVGTDALAAVTASSEVAQLLVGFFVGLSTGAGVLFSRFYGAGDREKLHDSIHTAIAFSIVFGIFMSIVGIIASPWLLDILDCPEGVWNESMVYLRIYLIGMLFTSVYNIGAAVLRAVGDSKNPLIHLVVSGILNIILDLVFVVVFDMGVAGVAIATVLAQLVSAVLVMNIMLRTDDIYKFSFKEMKVDWGLLKEIINLGFPAAIQTCINSISNFFIQSYISRLGAAAIAGFGVGKKVDRYVSMVACSIGLASTTFVSQNMGAKKPERAFRGLRMCLWMCFGAVAVLGIPTYYFGEYLCLIFTRDPEVIYYAMGMISYLIPLYYFQVLHQLFGQAIRGFGKSRQVMLLALIGNVGVRQLYLAIFTRLFSNHEVIFISFPVGWAVTGTIMVCYYYFSIKKPIMKQLKGN